MSVAEYADDAEAMSAIGEQHRRAMNGEAAGPIGGPAERIAAVYVYDEHPDNYNADQTMSADVFKKELLARVDAVKDKNDVVSVDQFVFEVRGIAHPMVDEMKKPFDSRYRAKATKELDISKLGEAA
jgi:hypothetical protein